MGAYIIAEAGVNHNGSLTLAKDLVRAAKKAGADCVKFQTFKSERLVSKTAKKAEYQVKNTGNNDASQLEMLKKLELSEDDFRELKKECEKEKIDFLSTAFDEESIDFLSGLGMKVWKIPSGEITNLPYLEKIASFREKVILSTGMATLDEVKAAVGILREKGTEDITVLHCTTEYPAPENEVNLNAMLTMKRELACRIGYSDHTKGILVPIAASVLGAEVIEKHFTLSKDMEGPDHKASLEPAEFAEMVKMIRTAESALGSPEKKPAPSEEKNIAVARKSIVAKTDIKKGEIFTEKNLTVKRPGDGVSPMKWHEVMGLSAKRDFFADEKIEL